MWNLRGKAVKDGWMEGSQPKTLYVYIHNLWTWTIRWWNPGAGLEGLMGEKEGHM